MAKSTEAEKVCKRIKAAFDHTAAARRSYLINRAMIAGRHRVFWDSRVQAVRDLPHDDEQLHVVANRILPATRSSVANLTRRPLTFQVLPEQADDASARASRLAESILLGRVVDKHWEHKRSDLTWALLAGGTAGLCLNWDPAAGRPLGLVETNGRKYGTGDASEEALSILDFAVEPGAGQAETANWWVRNEALPPEVVKERFGLKDTPSTDARASGISMTYDYTSQQSTDPQLTNVFYYYARPGDDYENGKVCVVVGSEQVDESDWPFPFEGLNLFVVRDVVVPGQWFGEASMSSAVSIQQAYNAALSSVVDHTRRAGNARLLIPQSVVDMMDELTDSAGQTIAYPDGAERPEWVSPPQLPDYVTRMPERLANELDNVLALGDISRGEAPGRVDSALGISILSENMTAPLSSISDEVARAFGGLASGLLSLYATKVQDKRSQRVSRKPGYPAEDVAWTGRDLMGHTRASVPAESLAPKSRAAGNAMAMEMLGAGVVDVAGAARLIEMPGTEGLLQVTSPHVAKATRENHKLALGRQIVPMDLDNADHLNVHIEFVLSEVYEQLDEDGKTVVMDHVRAHQAILSPDVPEVPGPAEVPPADPLAPMGDAPPPMPTMPPVGPALPPMATAPMPGPGGLSEADVAMALLEQQGLL